MIVREGRGCAEGDLRWDDKIEFEIIPILYRSEFLTGKDKGRVNSLAENPTKHIENLKFGWLDLSSESIIMYLTFWVEISRCLEHHSHKAPHSEADNQQSNRHEPSKTSAISSLSWKMQMVVSNGIWDGQCHQEIRETLVWPESYDQNKSGWYHVIFPYI